MARKTTTSTEVKRRYNDKVYDVIRVSGKKDTAAAYKARCDELGIPYSQILHEAIRRFLADAE